MVKDVFDRARLARHRINSSGTNAGYGVHLAASPSKLSGSARVRMERVQSATV